LKKQQRAREANYPKIRIGFASRRFGLSAKGAGPELTKHYFVSFFIKRLERVEAYFCLDFLVLFHQGKSMKKYEKVRLDNIYTSSLNQ